MPILRALLISAVLQLPGRLRSSAAKLLFKSHIDATARIGLSYFDARTITIGAHAEIGSGNVFKGLSELHIGDRSIMRNSNHVFGDGSAGSVFEINNDARVMSRHYFDVCDPVVLGVGCEVAGRGSQFITHSQEVRFETNRHVQRGIEVGRQAIIGTGSIVIMSDIADGCYVGAGAVVVKSLDQPQSVYAGVPAEWRKSLAQDAKPLHTRAQLDD